MLRLLTISLILSVVSPAQAAWKVTQTKVGTEIEIHSVDWVNRKIDQRKIQIRQLPEKLDEGVLSTTNQIYEEIIFQKDALPRHYRNWKQTRVLSVEKGWAGSEVRQLVQQGPDKNRIVLTIVGDGYTVSEKNKFFQDAQRITDDLFQEVTFSSYLPLFNVYAVFVPSNDSGISDRVRKDTALGLYRTPVGSKRAIMYRDSTAIERALDLAPASADYPILIANDDFYGGLGGRYAITTRSLESGSMVLRHELGHNFGNVGEEYDNGFVYQGANHSSSSDVPWAHWINQGRGVFHAKQLAGAYVWKDLNTGSALVRFQVPTQTNFAQGDRLHLKISTVGWETPEDVHVLLDGVQLDLQGKGLFTKDRSFFNWTLSQSLAPGDHLLEVRQNRADGDNVLAFANVYLYPAEYDEQVGRVAAFRNFYSPNRPAGYRPTENTCLMRNMRSKTFCTVDYENMWVRFLNQVDLLDSLEVKRNQQIVQLSAPNLDGLEVRWFKVNGNQKHELEAFRNLRELNTKELSSGSYRVELRFRTPEVRKYNSRFEDSAEFSL